MRPPVIESIKVENYRVLQSVEIKKLKPFTVLVGPNGSGKSTLFDVFAFMEACFTSGIRHAWDKRGGARQLRSRGAKGPIAVQISYREQSDSKLLTYRLEIDEERGRPVVAREFLRWTRSAGPGRPSHILDFRQGAGYFADDETGVRTQEHLDGPDKLAVNALGQFKSHPRVAALRRFISGWYLSYLSVAEGRKSPAAGPQERLSQSGDNISNVLQYLSENHPERLRSVTEALRDTVPALESVEYRTSPDGRLVLFVKDAPFDEPVLASNASDGTLKLLSYLTLLYDPDPAPFIGIEEPENHLYPSVLSGLAHQCRQSSERSQVLVTTHSHDFINSCRADEVVALYRGADGYTRVVRPDAIPLVNDMLEHGALLGSLWQENYFDELPEPRTPVNDLGPQS
ncbi:Predicted ATPase [Streptomyces zhaozhouensis]|uniref:Predicted ATPase n=1 Tax=Streptomyces zhaozhouensis TaxID=1300267 RepID=A0A286DPQ1_9ACTN|nr:AAA family ATPase [Streptomyces zhaozhouensis]SOD60620.1 Predicted ATPase [Streptomyces zhaozhouensis]